MNPDNQTQPVPIPVDQPIIEDVGKSTNEYIKAHYKKFIFLYIFVSVAIVATLVYFGSGAAFAAVLILLILGATLYASVQDRIVSQFIQQFGASIGFSYAKSVGIDTVAGRLFQVGHGQTITNVLSGTREGKPERIFSYCFAVGSGKNECSYSCTVFEHSLDGSVPDILLFSSKIESQPYGWLAVDEMMERGNGSKDEIVRLEGDFNKYFRLAVPKGFEMEAYQIFTPDVMAKLIDLACDFSFELSGNKLYIFATRVIGKREDFDAIFALSAYVSSLFQKNTERMKVITQADLVANSGN